MANLATNKTQMSTGLAILPNHVSDSIDALTGAKQFDDVTLEQRNIVARGLSIANMHPNKTRGVTLAGTKVVTGTKMTGFVANAMSYAFMYYHITPTVSTLRNIFSLLSKADSSRTAFKADLTSNSLAFTSYASDADGTGTLISTRTLKTNKLYLYKIVFSTSSIQLYENNILVYNGSVTYDSEFISDILAGVQIKIQQEGKWSRIIPFTFALNSSDRNVIWNNGRPDKAILPDYMKWGSKSKYNSTYAGNEVLDAVGWSNGNTTAPMPVGLKRPNAIGLYDMSGNVWEWCWDWHGNTYPTSTNNPTGATSGSSRVRRGGSWRNDDARCQVANRSNFDPVVSYDDLGFRLCRKYSETLLSNDVIVQAKLAGMQAIGSGTYTDCTIDSFLMQKYVVTVQEFSGTGTDTKPKVNINWYNACKYANEKSSASGLEKCYHVEGNYDESTWGSTPAIECDFTKSGYRLPTEAEWEWAARQGSVGAVADYKSDGIVLSLDTETTIVTAGNLYETTAAITTNEAALIGAYDNKVGTQFVAKESTTLSGTGRVKPMITALWKDASTNGLNATVSGSPNVIETQVESVQGQGISEFNSKLTDFVNQTTTTPTISVDAGWFNNFIVVRNNSANQLTFALGTSGGDKSVIGDTVIAAGATLAIRCNSPMTLNLTASRTLYVTASGTALNYDTKQLTQKAV